MTAIKILVTRPQAQNTSFLNAISELGDEALVLPMLAIEPLTASNAASSLAQIKARVLDLAHYHHVIFISTNAVDIGCQWFDQYWPQTPVLPAWYAIGKATAKTMGGHGLPAREGDSTMNSEALLALPELQMLDGQKVLIVRGEGGRDHLKSVLQDRGAKVDYLEVYRRRSLSYPQGTTTKLIENGMDIVTVTSGETIQALLDQAMIDGTTQQILEIPVIVPGIRLENLAREHGFHHIFVAKNAGLDAMIAAVNAVKTTRSYRGFSSE
ncbi:Uroporphyrinogen-III synthase [BD1-7 clade bacterium]|uniref:Uroporphyrinogen-III synthase n=1 Tax=BD1-7 clade bacterium TaxID=2029982 RepID=A0A5S9MXS7_9GAMM|nr:Uroporphyrinogen-III synthase [BD1-7 clade bacterium]CAA0084003.1 Uroporphyrinogen-III synthase [BD1-7 clade bacterium]